MVKKMREDIRLTDDIFELITEYRDVNIGCDCEDTGELPYHVIELNDLPILTIKCLTCGLYFDPVSRLWEEGEEIERYNNRQQRTSRDNRTDKEDKFII